MKTAKAVGLGLLIILAVVFIVQNLKALTHAETFRFDLLLVSVQTPPLMTALILLLCFGLGFLAAYALGFSDRRRLKKTVNALKQQRVRLEEEVNSLRNLPLTTPTGGRDVVRPNGAQSA
ncbi:MAG: lipopolysaccharide assembly protein LapA domain-containing protein [Thermodesulfobacteriota bacterium]